MKFLLISLLNLALTASAFADVNEILKRSGTLYLLESLPAQFEAGFNQGLAQAGADPGAAGKVSEIVKNSFNTKDIASNVTSALDSSLSASEVETLTTWYATPLAARITDLENKASQPAAAEQLAANVQTYLANQPRMEKARQIEGVMKATDRALGMAKMIQEPMLTAMLSDMGEAQIQTLMNQVNAQIEQSRPQLSQYMLAGFVATYESLSDEELDAYIEFLSTPAAQKFYDVVQTTLSQELGKFMPVLGVELISIFKGS